MSNRKYSRHYELVAVGEPYPTTKISSSHIAYDAIMRHFSGQYALPKLTEYQEHFIFIALDRSNKVISMKTISTGGIHGTVVDVRIIAKYLTEMMASACILAHNHPSGNLKPSAQDDQMTSDIKKGLNLLEILVLDHLIFSDKSFYSYADQGRLT